MSGEIVAQSAEVHNVEDEAYEPVAPTYDEAFPTLPGARGGAAPAPPKEPVWATKATTKMMMKTSLVTQVFRVPLEERRYNQMAEQQFGEKGGQQAKICSEIMSKCGVSIEMSLARDQSLTVVISGKNDKVMQARKLVVQQLQTQARTTMNIPQEHHRFILGPKGKRLQELELNTTTKISVPRKEDNSSVIQIVGTNDGIERARHEIQLISDEQAKLALERMHIEKIYHPFVCGPDNKIVKDLMEKTGARISVPPPSVMKDEVVVSGEKEGVQTCVQTIKKIYEERKRKCNSVSVEVRKSQHKYVIGPRGSNLSEILEQTDVSVEVPPLESNSETITLRGDPDKLGQALTMVYSKANSVIIEEVEAPAWLHRFIIGRKGATVKKITQDLPKVHIEFTDGEDKIVVEGPPEQVKEAKDELEKATADLLKRMAFAEIDINQKYHRHIIGRSGANVTRIKNETGCAIKIPSDTDPTNIIRIEGSPEGVARAKKELLEMVQKMENEKSRDIIIEQRFHKTMIGAAGGKIKEIRDKFNQVQITFPDAKAKSDVVQMRGPKADVDKCYKYLMQMHDDLKLSNHQAEVKIFKDFHKNIIGKGGSNIRKIRDETDTKIDLPSENSLNDIITITGKRENVEKARAKIEAIQKELANIKEISIEIPHRFHNSIIGAKGRLIRSIMDECGGVIIRFPSEGSNSDKVIIRGPVDDVENARKQLLELANERKESNFTAEVRAKPEYHKFLIGRGGANIRKVREHTGARVIFPTSGDTDQEIITIIGKKESVDSAKAELESLVKDLDNIVEGEIAVDPKYHRHFVARRGEVLRDIAEDYGGVTVSFPRSGVKSDKVTLKGSKDCVDGAKKRILEIVADLESQITIECVIAQKFHRTVMGAKGSKVQDITKEYDVAIKFPDRPTENAEPATPPQENGDANLVNGDAESESSENSDAPKKCDIITITGKKENCEGAKQALLNLVPITEEINVPFDYHRFVIGQRGRDVRKMMEDNDVNISIPPAEEKSDIVKITGPPANVKRAMEAMKDRMSQLEDEQKDREARGFTLEVQVSPEYHPKIIGRRGAIITKIRTDNDVQIQFPEKNSEQPDVITITGYETNASQAKDAILKIVSDLESQTQLDCKLDHRIHSRLIGAKGRTIRKIMEEFNVDIKFPARDSGDPDLVVISGAEDNAYDCRDHLLNLEEEYMQDIADEELMQQYTKPTSSGDGHQRPHNTKGFMVRNAPWSKAAPDMSSTDDFPDLGGPAASSNKPAVVWGPAYKR